MSIYKERLEIIAGLQPQRNIVEMKLEDTPGCVLQQDVRADISMPPFNKSAVDGYACRKEDISEALDIIEHLAAGSVPSRNIGKRQCSKIMTGAPVPPGADCVFMIEDAEQTEEGRVRCANPHSKQNICYLGEDYKKGDLLLEIGTILKAEHLAVIAGAGLSSLLVSVMPKIGLIITGSELVEYNKYPEEGKIRNTNGIQIISLLKKINIYPVYYGLVEDDYEALQLLFRRSLEENDMVIFTGGAAVGDFDLVPDLIENEGFELKWTRTGLKPGNPMTFAVKGEKAVFGLSGNPVSSLIQFEYLVKPIIFRLLGANPGTFRLKMCVEAEYQRKNAERLGVVPVRVNNEGNIEYLPFNGSAHINAFSTANALMEIPAGIKKLNKGDQVYVRPI